MVQTQFKCFLSLEQQQRAFNNAVSIVYNAFPRQDDTKGQMYETWQICNEYLQHVLNLRDCVGEMTSIPKFKFPWEFCELLIQCQR